jgi:hypothetical protein
LTNGGLIEQTQYRLQVPAKILLARNGRFMQMLMMFFLFLAIKTGLAELAGGGQDNYHSHLPILLRCLLLLLEKLLDLLIVPGA